MLGDGLDVVVLGAGPAGLAVARSSAAVGLRVACIAPNCEQPWQANYAAWVDELAEPATSCLEASWARAQVYWSAAPHTLVRRYARIDRGALQRTLLDQARASGVLMLDATALSIDHEARHSIVHTDKRTALSARVVVDASGAGSAFVRRVDRRPPAFQSAYGLRLGVNEHPFELDTVVFMDLRDVAPGPPSFLYAMPLSRSQLFVEETSLAARPPLPHDTLKRRLMDRLQGLGVQVVEQLDEERCTIAMGLAPPEADQPIIAFGAAGAMVHPATGYQISRALNAAPQLAAAIAAGLDHGGPAQAATNAYQLLWPTSQRRCWELYTFGMEALCRFDGASLRKFMRAFFQLPEPVWRGYLAGELSFAALSKAMWSVFSHADAELRWRLVQLGASGGARRLFGSISIPNQV